MKTKNDNDNIKILVEEADNVFVINLEGSITAHSYQETLNCFQKFEEFNSEAVILNMEKVSFIDSAGIGLVIYLHRILFDKDERLLVADLQSQPEELFALLQIDKVVECFSSVSQAMQAVAGA